MPGRTSTLSGARRPSSRHTDSTRNRSVSSGRCAPCCSVEPVGRSTTFPSSMASFISGHVSLLYSKISRAFTGPPERLVTASEFANGLADRVNSSEGSRLGQGGSRRRPCRQAETPLACRPGGTVLDGSDSSGRTGRGPGRARARSPDGARVRAWPGLADPARRRAGCGGPRRAVRGGPPRRVRRRAPGGAREGRLHRPGGPGRPVRPLRARGERRAGEPARPGRDQHGRVPHWPTGATGSPKPTRSASAGTWRRTSTTSWTRRWRRRPSSGSCRTPRTSGRWRGRSRGGGASTSASPGSASPATSRSTSRRSRTSGRAWRRSASSRPASCGSRERRASSTP